MFHDLNLTIALLWMQKSLWSGAIVFKFGKKVYSIRNINRKEVKVLKVYKKNFALTEQFRRQAGRAGTTGKES
jgi:hypothetical protein